MKLLAAASVVLLLGGVAIRAQDAARAADAVRPARATPAAFAPQDVLGKYCVTCHNDRLKTAGLVIDPATASDVAAGAERWEKVVRKLRTASMPPANMPRPDAATYDALASYLEEQLDRAAAAHPQLGKLPL